MPIKTLEAFGSSSVKTDRPDLMEYLRKLDAKTFAKLVKNTRLIQDNWPEKRKLDTWNHMLRKAGLDPKGEWSWVFETAMPLIKMTINSVFVTRALMNDDKRIVALLGKG